MKWTYIGNLCNEIKPNKSKMGKNNWLTRRLGGSYDKDHCGKIRLWLETSVVTAFSTTSAVFDMPHSKILANVLTFINFLPSQDELSVILTHCNHIKQ